MGFEPSTPTLATGYRGMRQGIRGAARLRLTVHSQYIGGVALRRLYPQISRDFPPNAWIPLWKGV
jgi:hypothetical protein